MLSYSGTAVTTTGELKVTKSIQSLIVACTNTAETFTTENITMWIEKQNADNVQICTAIPLLSFAMLTNFGADAIQADATYSFIAYCELSPKSAIRLYEGESLKFRIDGLQTLKTYAIHTIEDAQVGTEFFKFDRKTFASEDLVRTVNVVNSEMGVLNLHSSISQVSLKYANGNTIKYLPFELRTMSRDIDPVFAISNAGVVSQGQSTLVALPLVGVAEVEVVKSAGTLIELIVYNTQSF